MKLEERQKIMLYAVIVFIIGFSIGRISAPSKTIIDKEYVYYVPPIDRDIDLSDSDPFEDHELETSEKDIVELSRMTYREARGLPDTEKSACIWCVLNRVDSSMFPNTIDGVLSQKNQFSGYGKDTPYTDEIRALVEDVLMRWELEKLGKDDVGRTLPKGYFYFKGDGKHNYFRDAYKEPYTIWDWSLLSPYQN